MTDRKKIGKKSRTKGQSNERKVAKLFEKWWGGTFTRTPLSGGWANKAEFNVSGDIISDDPSFPFIVELKKQEGWTLEQLFNPGCKIFSWIEQVENDSKGTDKIPILIFCKNRSPYYLCYRQTSNLNFKKLNKITFIKDNVGYEIILFEDFIKSYNKEEITEFYKVYYLNLFIQYS